MTLTAAAPVFLARFACLGAECEDTCCKGWNMQVDPATQARYAAEAPGLLADVTGEGEAAVMRRDSKTDYCVKFEGLCGIQRVHGAAFLGDACYSYPRASRRLGGALCMTGTLSCPEIVRLSLFEDGAMDDAEIENERIPQNVQDYLPEGINTVQARIVHRTFLDAALDAGAPAERSFMRIFTAAESLGRITPSAWPDAVPFYLQHAEASLCAADPRPTDPSYLLQALCGLVAAAKYVHHTRLMQTIADIEQALHLSIRWDTLAIAALPDSGYAVQALHSRWKAEWEPYFAPILRRYLAMQISLALFPFSGFGDALSDRAAVIGIRMATVKLGLMSICAKAGGPPQSAEIVRVIQSLSRFLDHLGGAEFSLKIYRETGWLTAGRLRGLLGDAP